MVIYFDIVLLINFVMNLIILYFTALLLNSQRALWKISIGAAIGCLFLLSMLSSEFLMLQSFPGKILISIIMVLVSFGPYHSFQGFMKAIGVFYFLSFMMGGGVLAFFYVLNFKRDFISNILLLNSISIPWWILLVSSSALLLFIKFFWPLIQNKLLKDTLLVPITIIIDNVPLNIAALIDTGNDLFEPISNYPVIIVELDAMKGFFDKEIKTLFEKGFEEGLSYVESLVRDPSWAARLRIIPFESIGKSKGLMMGIKPDLVSIEYENQVFNVKNTIIGIYQRMLSPDGTYRALLNPVLLKE